MEMRGIATRRLAVGLAASFVVVCTAQCSKATPTSMEEQTPSIPSLVVVSSGSRVDTIGSYDLGAPLVIEVRQADGRPAVGATVELLTQVVSVNREGRIELRPNLLLGTAGHYPGHGQLSIEADGLGRVEAVVVFGDGAGDPGLTVRVPGLGLDTVIPFTVLPGRTTLLMATPSDTVLYVGAVAPYGAYGVDRAWNRTQDIVSVTSLDPAVATFSGQAVTGLAPGRVRTELRWGSLVDTASLSIVPEGTLAVFRDRYNSGDSSGIVLLELDLHRVQPLDVTVGGSAFQGLASWSPDGDHLVERDAQAQVLHILRLDGTKTPILSLPYPDHMIEQSHPRYTADGTWIYFSAWFGYWNETQIWRMHPDGTEAAQVVGQSRSRGYHDRYPSPSRDGSRVVFETSLGEHTLRFVDPATDIEQVTNVHGISPRWSPATDQIAFLDLDSHLMVSPSSLTTPRMVVTDGTRYSPWIDWSPDGQWLVATVLRNSGKTGGGIEVINVATGERIPVPGTNAFLYPASLVIEDARKVAAPAWSADGGTLAWGTLGSLMTATGPVVTTILHDATINGPSLPRFSPDGRWIYFNGKSMNGSSVSNSVLFRIDLGDRTVEELTPTGDVDDSAPDVSPDGTMIAFGSTRWTPYPYQSMVRLLDPSTLVVTDLGVRGTRPRWSPDGQWLAYVVAGAGWRPNPVGREFGAGPLAIVRPGGTDRRVIHTGLKTFHPGIDWSPDGKYLIASNSMSQMDIVVVETGEIIPLTFLRGEGVDIYHPDWKPPA